MKNAVLSKKHVIQQAILWITLASLLGVSSFIGLFRRFSGMPDTVVASVNGDDISRDLFARRVQEEEHRISFIKQKYGESVAQYIGNAENLALSSLIQERLLSQAADQLGVVIDPQFAAERVNDPYFTLQFLGEMVSSQVFTKEGSLDRPGLVKMLQRRGISIREFEDFVEDILRRMIVGSLVAGTSYITSGEKEEARLIENASRDLEITTFPRSFYEKQVNATAPQDASDENRSNLIDVALSKDLREIFQKSEQEQQLLLKERGARKETLKNVEGMASLEKFGKEAEKIKLLTVPGTVVRIVHNGFGYYIKLLSIHKKSTASDDSKTLEQLLQTRIAALPYELIASLQKRATIVLNQSLLSARMRR